MKITNDATLAELQKEFEQLFPYLRIKFYATNYQQGKRSQKCHLLDQQLQVGCVRKNTNTGYFTIDKNMSVGSFEQLLWVLYGLHVQVFRKSYGKWLQTWATDNWSLQDQNHRSKIIGDKGNSKQVNATAR